MFSKLVPSPLPTQKGTSCFLTQRPLGDWIAATINGTSVYTQTGRVYQTFGQDGFPPSGNPVPEPAFYQMSAFLGMGLICVWRRRKKA